MLLLTRGSGEHLRSFWQALFQERFRVYCNVQADRHRAYCVRVPGSLFGIHPPYAVAFRSFVAATTSISQAVFQVSASSDGLIVWRMISAPEKFSLPDKLGFDYEEFKARMETGVEIKRPPIPPLWQQMHTIPVQGCQQAAFDGGSVCVINLLCTLTACCFHAVCDRSIVAEAQPEENKNTLSVWRFADVLNHKLAPVASIPMTGLCSKIAVDSTRGFVALAGIVNIRILVID